MNSLFIVAIAASALVVFGALYFTLRDIGLQEANDPVESRPDDLTEYEKQHVDRPDVHDVGSPTSVH
jgi:hypothetical protein